MGTLKSAPVLVVNSRPDVAGVVRIALRNVGMLDVETVFDAPQALQQLENRKFALAIIDLMMTPMTGIELIATIRKSERTPHLAIIATSGIGDERAVLEAKAAGADAFMLKPFSTTALRSKVATLMSAQLV